MQTNRQFCFTHASGEEIYLCSLNNQKGTQIQISNYGGIITSFRIVMRNSDHNDIVLGFDDMNDYLNEKYLASYPWFGAAIGRYGNRIKNGEFVLEGKRYKLSVNNGNDQLHGGKEGFDKKPWKILSHTSSSLHLFYLSPDGEEGFPGNLTVNLIFELSDNDELSYTYNATTDKPTPVNLTHHSYFNFHNGAGTIGGHQVRIPASIILEQDEHLVTTGGIITVKDKRFDFTSLKRIDDNWNAEDGYDQSYVIDDKSRDISLVAEAWSEDAETGLEVWSTEPVVHFYSGKWIPPVTGKKGIKYGPYSGFCLETQVHPNAVNIPHFPNTILYPGETYHHHTIYRVIRDSRNR